MRIVSVLVKDLAYLGFVLSLSLLYFYWTGQGVALSSWATETSRKVFK